MKLNLEIQADDLRNVQGKTNKTNKQNRQDSLDVTRGKTCPMVNNSQTITEDLVDVKTGCLFSLFCVGLTDSWTGGPYFLAHPTSTPVLSPMAFSGRPFSPREHHKFS